MCGFSLPLKLLLKITTVLWKNIVLMMMAPLNLRSDNYSCAVAFSFELEKCFLLKSERDAKGV